MQEKSKKETIKPNIARTERNKLTYRYHIVKLGAPRHKRENINLDLREIR
jgi:hypothetical protein